jgi:hypothetical protein
MKSTPPSQTEQSLLFYSPHRYAYLEVLKKLGWLKVASLTQDGQQVLGVRLAPAGPAADQRRHLRHEQKVPEHFLGHEAGEQSDQMGRIFAQLMIVYFGCFYCRSM